MSDKLKYKKFSCTKCGTPYEAYPPDDKHRFATMVGKEANKDHIIVKYTCKNCGNSNIIYWTHSPLESSYHV
jgi:predicted RNA-binding Zn-ribbon protein involved in translation (DUF1610 family)